MRRWRLGEKLGYAFLSLSMLIVMCLFLGVLGFIVAKGIEAMSLSFLIEMPKSGMLQGGILPAIVGTFLISLITAIVAIPLGLGCAIYLHEYAYQGLLNRWIRTSVRNLAGVPSIIYGLFGLALFVEMLDFGASLLSSGLTLGLLTLPWTITTSDEALKNVPQIYREGGYALGGRKWQVIRTIVLPHALPGIMTGSILGLARAAGETAAILFTGVAFYLPYLPDSIFSQFMALPYHLYVMATQYPLTAKIEPITYATALVLIALILTMNLLGIIIRYRMRHKEHE